MTQAGAHALGRPLLDGVCLAFVAGFVDSCGYIALFGLFTAHVTGNFVTFGAALVAPDGALIAKLLALPIFILTVAAVRIWVIARQPAGESLRLSLVLAQLIGVAGFMAVGIMATPIVSAETPLAILAGLLAVAAMAIQNASSRLAFAELAPTTVMTGNVTQSVIDGVDLLFPRWANPKPEAGQRFRAMWPSVVGFAIGALGGALGYGRFGFISLAAPTLVLGGIAALVGGSKE